MQQIFMLLNLRTIAIGGGHTHTCTTKINMRTPRQGEKKTQKS
jgi:hypothetical protein